MMKRNSQWGMNPLLEMNESEIKDVPYKIINAVGVPIDADDAFVPARVTNWTAFLLLWSAGRMAAAATMEARDYDLAFRLNLMTTMFRETMLVRRVELRGRAPSCGGRGGGSNATVARGSALSEDHS